MSEIEEEVDITNIWYKMGEILSKMETRILDRLDVLIENQLTKAMFEAKYGKQPEIKTIPKETKPKIEVKKSPVTEPKKDEEEDYILKNTKVKFETEKAYLLQDENDLVAWIPKKCMKSINADNNIAVVHGWFKDKVQFNEEEPFGS